ncbi:MAG TPA: SAM-dependent methyltransferase [Acidimicrobiia bacterium]|nr:SAM-dependent methyltransferase [Acidimicrobiia bacterium]
MAIVQRHIRAALDQCAPGPIRVISLCAGQGHDLIGALEGHPRASDVRARLVELHPANCEAALANAPAGVEILCADASLTASYDGAVPADIVLANGVFGNISDDDIVNTIETLPSLCAPGATVTWTRHRREPDLTPQIRQWFEERGFAEVAFEGPEGFIFGVGVNRLSKPPEPFRETQMFEFVGSDQNWEQGQPI